MTLNKANMLTAQELSRYRVSSTKILPTRGLKKFEPDNTDFEKAQIESSLEERNQLLKEQRVERAGSFAKGTWNDELKKALVTKVVGRQFQVVGHEKDKQIWLYAEEALYLLEQNYLELSYGGVPLSIMQGYHLLLGEQSGCTLNEYKVYAHLMRQGYRVLRHAKSLTVTRYEKTVGLDRYVLLEKRRDETVSSQKTKNRSSSPGKKRNRSASPEPLSVKISRTLENKKDAPTEQEVILLSDSDNETASTSVQSNKKHKSDTLKSSKSEIEVVKREINKVLFNSSDESDDSDDNPFLLKSDKKLDVLNRLSSSEINYRKSVPSKSVASRRISEDKKATSAKKNAKNSLKSSALNGNVVADDSDSDDIQEIIYTKQPEKSKISPSERFSDDTVAKKRRRNEVEIEVFDLDTKPVGGRKDEWDVLVEDVTDCTTKNSKSMPSLETENRTNSSLFVKNQYEKRESEISLKSESVKTENKSSIVIRSDSPEICEIPLKSESVKSERESRTIIRSESPEICEIPVKGEKQQSINQSLNVKFSLPSGLEIYPVEAEKENDQETSQQRNGLYIRHLRKNRPVKHVSNKSSDIEITVDDTPKLDTEVLSEAIASLRKQERIADKDIDVVDLSSGDEHYTHEDKRFSREERRSILESIPSVEKTFTVHVQTPPSYLLPPNVRPKHKNYYIQLWRLKAPGFGSKPIPEPQSSATSERRYRHRYNENSAVNPWMNQTPVQNPYPPVLNDFNSRYMQYQNIASMLGGVNPQFFGTGPSLLGPAPIMQYPNPLFQSMGNFMPYGHNFQNTTLYGHHHTQNFYYNDNSGNYDNRGIHDNRSNYHHNRRGNYRGKKHFGYRGRGYGRPYHRHETRERNYSPAAEGGDRQIPALLDSITENQFELRESENKSDDEKYIVLRTSPTIRKRGKKKRKNLNVEEKVIKKKVRDPTKGRFFNPPKKHVETFEKLKEENVQHKVQSQEKDDPDEVVFLKEQPKQRVVTDVITLNSDSEEEENKEESKSSSSSSSSSSSDAADDDSSSNDEEEMYEDYESDDVDDEVEEDEVEEKDEEDFEPIISQEDCTSLDNVLSKLRIFEEVPVNPGEPTDEEDSLRISYDVYLPHVLFRKATPGLPNYRLVVRDFDDPFPEPGHISWLLKDFQDGVPLLMAEVSYDSVSFFTLNEIQLPAYYNNK